MVKVAVILGGCGFLDGSEIHESVSTLLALDRRDADVQVFAPDENQAEVINHVTNEVVKEKRNVMIESARIARGAIKDVKEANAEDFDAVIFPGGTGIAKNLFTYALDGSDFKVNADVERLIIDTLSAGKPMGFICIAPVLLAKVANHSGMKVTLTMGDNEGAIRTVEALGAQVQPATTREIVVDEENKVVTTPAYITGKRISDVVDGIDALVEKVISFI